MSNSIKCTLLPLSQERFLILPNTSLAEVVDNRSDLLVMGARDGIIGKIQWRGHSVPLVSYEAAIGEVVQDGGSFVHFNQKGGFPKGDIVTGPNARKNLVHDPQVSGFGRYITADLCQQDNQRGLPKDCGFTTHIGPGNHDELLFFPIE